MIVATHGILASGKISNIPLLDAYTGSAAAYSLRKLRTDYTGSAIRVRRSSDNTSQDIGFVNNVLDTTSLLSFVGSSNGYVSIWYDQSGNGRNSIQNTLIYQPRIVNLGIIDVFSSKNSLKFAYGNLINSLNASLPIQNISSVFIVNSDVVQNASSSIRKTLLGLENTDAYVQSSTGLSVSKSREGTNGVSYHIPSTGLEATNSFQYNYSKSNQIEILSAFNNNANFKLFKNNLLIDQKIGDNRLSGFDYSYQIGASQNGVLSRFYTGNIFELIIYISDKSTDRIGIENNINSYYSIF